MCPDQVWNSIIGPSTYGTSDYAPFESQHCHSSSFGIEEPLQTVNPRDVTWDMKVLLSSPSESWSQPILYAPDAVENTTSSNDRESPCTDTVLTPSSQPEGCGVPDSIVTRCSPQQSATNASALSSCKICNRAFADRKSLWNHDQSVHKKRRYDCDFEGCTYRATRAANLRRHKRTFHEH